MNCYLHSDQTAVAYCRTCGRALCQDCRHESQGTIFCQEHAPVQAPAAATERPAHIPSSSSPGLAFVLGLIPGVGAVYNRQYVKGLVHVVILGMLISIMASQEVHPLEPLFGLLVGLWFFYMPFEAYHTASARQRGEPADEFSSIFPVKSQAAGHLAGPVVLIALGVVFLLNTMGLLPMRTILHWWPLSLLALGGYMLFVRITGRLAQRDQTREAHDEQ